MARILKEKFFIHFLMEKLRNQCHESVENFQLLDRIVSRPADEVSNLEFWKRRLKKMPSPLKAIHKEWFKSHGFPAISPRTQIDIYIYIYMMSEDKNGEVSARDHISEIHKTWVPTLHISHLVVSRWFPHNLSNGLKPDVFFFFMTNNYSTKMARNYMLEEKDSPGDQPLSTARGTTWWPLTFWSWNAIFSRR